MSLGIATFTAVHVLLSLAGIGTGFVVVYGFLTANRLDRWTAAFLSTTVATSVTGFLFPVDRFLPSHAIGIISLVALTVALVARYTYHLADNWRATYVVSAMVSFYLNFFVLIVQSFLKVPALKALAPTQSEPPFAIAQGIALLLFVGFGIAAVIRFRSDAESQSERAVKPSALLRPAVNGSVA